MRTTGAAVGFYWTLPVRWAGFTKLPKDVNEAAELSRTIRYQRDTTRRYAQDHRLKLIHEEVFLEIEPDRGTRHVRSALRKVEKICQANQAMLLFVDFSEVQGWRSHGPMRDWARRTRIEIQAIYPDRTMIDGKSFDPHAHFSEWRDKQSEWVAGKADRANTSYAEASRLRAEGMSYAAIANRLNAGDAPTPTGRPWTGDNLRKFMASMSRA